MTFLTKNCPPIEVCAAGPSCAQTELDRKSNPRLIRSEKWQNESSPNFSNFCPEFPPEFSQAFSCFVSQEARTRKKKSPKIPALFQCKFPRQIHAKNIFTKFFWRAGQIARPQLGPFFCPEIRAFTGRDFFNRFQCP